MFLEQCISFGQRKDDFKVVWLVHVPKSVKGWIGTIELDMGPACIAGLDVYNIRHSIDMHRRATYER
jgi:hypothetical protein